MSPELKESLLKLLDERNQIKAEVIHDFPRLINDMLQLELNRGISIPETLIEILKFLSPTDRITALGSFGQGKEINNTVLHELAKNSNLFKDVLELVPEDSRMDLIDSLYKKKIFVLHKADYPEHLLVLLPSKHRLQTVKLKDKDRQTIVDLVARDPKRLQPLVDVVPKENLSSNHFLMSQDKYGFTALHKAATNPESIKIALNLLSPEERLSALQMTNQNSPYEDQSEFFSILDSASFSGDYEECIKEILKLLPIEDRPAALKTKGLEGRSTMDTVLENPELIKAVRALLPKGQYEVLEKANTTLIKVTKHMVETIITNIKTKKNARLTSAQSGMKINVLNILSEWLEKNKDLDEADPQNALVVPFFQAVCKLKRHPINFFSNPHSLKESQTLIHQHWNFLKQYHNECFKFTKEELTKIDSVEQMELLFKKKLIQLKPTSSNLT